MISLKYIFTECGEVNSLRKLGAAFFDGQVISMREIWKRRLHDSGEMPRCHYEANLQRRSRMENIARAFICNFEANGATFPDAPHLPDWGPYLALGKITHEPFRKEWERYVRKALGFIGAGFHVLQRKNQDVERYNLYNKLNLCGDFVAQARDFFQTLRPYSRVGTTDVGTTVGDYDFALTELASVMFAFLDDDEVLGNDMIQHIVCQPHPRYGGYIVDENWIPRSDIVATYSGQYINKTKKDQLILDIPPVLHYRTDVAETENHVLMIHSWRYLINEYVYWVGTHLETDHPRYSEKIRELYAQNPAHYQNENGDLEEFLLQVLGRILHNGMFEENARAYESFSMHAIMNLYMGLHVLHKMGARKTKILDAAQNAMEFLFARYAFQSFECKRIAPMRRNYEYCRRYGIGQNDYMLDIVGMLSGAYVFNDDAGCDEEHFDSRYWYRGDEESKTLGMGTHKALWTALFMQATGYTLPASIHDFLVDKHQGYWSRINTVYTGEDNETGGHYPMLGHPPLYFEKKGDQYYRVTRGPYASSPEFYFCTNHFLNSSGGQYLQYYDRISTSESSRDATNVYNWISVPYTVITKGDIGRNWGGASTDFDTQIKNMGDEILVMVGHYTYPHESKNGWTYKNFSYGYVTYEDDHERHLRWPQRYPASWSNDAQIREFGIGRAKFRILDRSQHGFYVILGQVSKSDPDGRIRNFGRGFWEIVPHYLFGSISEIEDRVKQYNPPEHFPNFHNPWWATKKGKRHYWYKLAVSGDTLQLHQLAGSSSKFQGIVKIWDHSGRELDLAEVHAKYSDKDEMKRMPLLEVREVDEDFRFTGTFYATAKGNGILKVFNPFVGETLYLDSQDIMNPKRSVEH